MVDFFEYAASSAKEREKNASEDQNPTMVKCIKKIRNDRERWETDGSESQARQVMSKNGFRP